MWVIADTLYIDDFLKTQKTRDQYGNPVVKEPTEGDINLAFELIVSRYNQPFKRTLISSERSIEQITGFDESIGSRIVEKCGENGDGEYLIKIAEDASKNWRLRGEL